jgi:large subunit ribosomal protein L24
MAFSTSWNSSVKPSRQRKYKAEAPLHLRQKLVNVHLSKELRNKHKKRAVAVRKGDKVTVMRGSFAKQSGKVERVDLKRTEIYVNGVERSKRDGTKAKVALHPSNLMITELSMDDKLRQKSLETKAK